MYEGTSRTLTQPVNKYKGRLLTKTHFTANSCLISQNDRQKKTSVVVGPRQSFLSGNQRVIGSHAKWASVIGHRWLRRPTRTNGNRCFLSYHFGCMSAISSRVACHTWHLAWQFSGVSTVMGLLMPSNSTVGVPITAAAAALPAGPDPVWKQGSVIT